MGITATNYPMFDNNVHIPSVYINVRNISTNKESDLNGENTMYTFLCICNVEVNGTSLDSIIIDARQSSPFTENLWDLAYSKLKERLSEESISYIDVI